MFFRHSSREAVDGSMLILPRASLEKGKDLKWTARQKYHESITFFRNSTRCAADGPMVIRRRTSYEKIRIWSGHAEMAVGHGGCLPLLQGMPSMASWRCRRAPLLIERRV